MLSNQGLEPLHVDPNAVWAAAAVPRGAALADPPVDGKVRRLRQVEPVVESPVICRGERDHELTGFLHAAVIHTQESNIDGTVGFIAPLEVNP